MKNSKISFIFFSNKWENIKQVEDILKFKYDAPFILNVILENNEFAEFLMIDNLFEK